MKHSKCHLCGDLRELVEGHIWPQFAYKRFVSDRTKGGSFHDFQLSRSSNRQRTERYFCQKCDNEVLGKLERYTAGWCDKIDAQATHLDYDERLLGFAVSLSWRVAKYYMARATSQPYRDILKKPSRAWKDYLLGRHSIGQYSQHLFVIQDPQHTWDKKMGAEVMFREGFILSQLGPLYFVGLLDRSQVSLADIKVWLASELRPDGGSLTAISEWRLGQNVTPAFMQAIQKHERWVLDQMPVRSKNKPMHRRSERP